MFKNLFKFVEAIRTAKYAADLARNHKYEEAKSLIQGK